MEEEQAIGHIGIISLDHVTLVGTHLLDISNRLTIGRRVPLITLNLL